MALLRPFRPGKIRLLLPVNDVLFHIIRLRVVRLIRYFV